MELSQGPKTHLLVQFIEDRTYFICDIKTLRKTSRGSKVRWLDNRFYSARIILIGPQSDLHSILEDICATLFIHIEKLPADIKRCSEDSVVEDKDVLDIKRYTISDVRECTSPSSPSTSNTNCGTSNSLHQYTLADEGDLGMETSSRSSITGFSDDSIADPHYNPSQKENELITYLAKPYANEGSQSTSITEFYDDSMAKSNHNPTVKDDDEPLFTEMRMSTSQPSTSMRMCTSQPSASMKMCTSQPSTSTRMCTSQSSISMRMCTSQPSTSMRMCTSNPLSTFKDEEMCTTVPEKVNVISDVVIKAHDRGIDEQTASSVQENIFLKKLQTYRPENSAHLNISKISHTKAKKYFCLFCKKLFSKLVLHLERIHHDEPAVRKFSILPRGCEERRKIIEVLRKEGSFQFNTDENHNTGDMIVSRRPMRNLVKNNRDYKTCPSCRGMYSKKSIRKHYPKCVPNWKKGDRYVTVMSKRVRADIHKSASSVLRDIVFPLLREDEVTMMIRYDELVIAYGNSLCTKYRLTHLHKMIRSKLRLIGRFLIEMKKIDPLFTDFASIYYPEKFDMVIEAVNNTAKLDRLLQEYKSPATASDLGTNLKKCGKLLVTLCIKNRDNTRKTLVEDFLKIFEEDFASIINKTVLENQLQHRRSQRIKLPTLQEISKFHDYLNFNRQKYFDNLLNSFDFATWKELASFTLISIQTFNRRRAGELERATLEDFRNLQNGENDDPDVYQCLSEDYQMNSKRYSRFEIRGKKARGVPVLLSNKLLECVELILQNREKAGVVPSNPYIFGIPGNSLVPLHLKACDLMRKFSEESGVENHHLIRGTQLRKKLATQSSVLNLDENEVTDLANFLGHAEKVHREHYRMPVVGREIGRVSKLLEMGVGSDLPSIGHSMHVEHPEQIEYSMERKEHNSGESIENDLFSHSHSEKRDSWSELNSSTTQYGKKRCVSPIGPVKRKSWSTPEKKKVMHVFGSNIETGELPSLPKCLLVIKSYSVLQERSPAQLKAWVHNEIQKKSKGMESNIKRVYWTSAEKEIMYREFAINLNDGILPSLGKCADVRKKYPELQHRNSNTLKAWVNNTLRKRKLQN